MRLPTMERLRAINQTWKLELEEDEVGCSLLFCLVNLLSTAWLFDCSFASSIALDRTCTD